jgi:hypothetical protein
MAAERPSTPGQFKKRCEDGGDRCLLKTIDQTEARSIVILRKEVIQPQVPLRLPCYDFTPVADLTVVGCLPKVSAPA